MEPAAKRQRTDIELCLKTPDGYEVVYRINLSSKFRKLMSTYCEIERLPRDFVDFLFGETRIKKQDTPEMLGMSPENNVISIKYNYSLPVIPKL